MQTLHEYNENSFALVCRYAPQGFPSRILSRNELPDHFLALFCIVKNPETENLLRTKRAAQNKFPIHVRLVKMTVVFVATISNKEAKKNNYIGGNFY